MALKGEEAGLNSKQKVEPKKKFCTVGFNGKSAKILKQYITVSLILEVKNMAEAKAHQRVKTKVAGKKGKTEKKLKYGGRFDASTPKKDFEYDRSGTTESLNRAIRKLKRSKKYYRILGVNKKTSIAKALKIARKLKANITIKYGKTYRKP